MARDPFIDNPDVNLVRQPVTQEDIDNKILRYAIEINPANDKLIEEVATRIALQTEREIAAAVLEFHAEEGRWPAYVWLEDWRSRPLPFFGKSNEADLADLRPPEVYVGDEPPEDAGTIYSTDILNDRPDLAVKFLDHASKLWKDTPNTG